MSGEGATHAVVDALPVIKVLPRAVGLARGVASDALLARLVRQQRLDAVRLALLLHLRHPIRTARSVVTRAHTRLVSRLESEAQRSLARQSIQSEERQHGCLGI